MRSATADVVAKPTPHEAAEAPAALWCAQAAHHDAGRSDVVIMSASTQAAA